MIELKEAVKGAEAFLRTHIDPAELKHLRLEEVELTEDGKFWKLTLGWVEPAYRQTVSSSLGFTRNDLISLPRVYKQFLVHTDSGIVKSMKMYEP